MLSGVAAQPGLFDGPGVDIRRKELYFEFAFEDIHIFPQQDGQGVGLFAGGAAGNPHPQRAARFPLLKKVGYDLLFQRGKGRRVAEEAGHSDQQFFKQDIHLGGGLLEIAIILLNPLNLLQGHAPFDTAGDCLLFVQRKIVAGLAAQQDINLVQPVYGWRSQRGNGCRWSGYKVA